MTTQPTADGNRLAGEQTPGPWSVGRVGDKFSYEFYVDAERITVADEITVEADARLIAAAPELWAFHDAWVSYEVAYASGSPDLVKKNRAALIAAHHAVLAKFGGR